MKIVKLRGFMAVQPPLKYAYILEKVLEKFGGLSRNLVTMSI